MKVQTTKPSFKDICTEHKFDIQKWQKLATTSGVPFETVEAMCNGTAVPRADAERVLTAFSEFTHSTWTLNNLTVLVHLTFADLYELHQFDTVSLSELAHVPLAIVDQMLCGEPVSKDAAQSVLQALSNLLGQSYSLETVVVKLSDIDLQQADLEVETIYALIRQQRDGILLDAIAERYSSRNVTVPYAVARLLADGRIEVEERSDGMYCVAVETDAKESGA